MLVSHRLDELAAHCARVVVIRDGRASAELSGADLTPERIARELVAGTVTSARTSDERVDSDEVVLEVARVDPSPQCLRRRVGACRLRGDSRRDGRRGRRRARAGALARRPRGRHRHADVRRRGRVRHRRPRRQPVHQSDRRGEPGVANRFGLHRAARVVAARRLPRRGNRRQGPLRHQGGRRRGADPFAVRGQSAEGRLGRRPAHRTGGRRARGADPRRRRRRQGGHLPPAAQPTLGPGGRPCCTAPRSPKSSSAPTGSCW